MPPLRFSIAGFMALVLFLALGLAAFCSGAEYWFTGLYTAMVAILLTAVVAARYGRRRAGAFWFGFAAFGWGFFLLGLSIPQSGEFTGVLGQPVNVRVNPALATTALLSKVYPRLVRIQSLRQLNSFGNTVAIGHLVMTALVATMGGGLAVLLRIRHRPKSDPAREGPPLRRLRVRLIPVALGALLAAGLTTAYVLRQPRPQISPSAYLPPELYEPSDPIYGLDCGSLGQVLGSMGEPSLWRRSQSDREASVYRLTWMDPGDPTVCIRVEKKAGVATIKTTVVDDSQASSAGAVLIDRTATLTEEQWDRLVSGLAASKFWELAGPEPGGTSDQETHLVVEAAQSGYYHLVDRSASKKDLYLALCRTFLDLAGLLDATALERLDNDTVSGFRSVPLR